MITVGSSPIPSGGLGLIIMKNVYIRNFPVTLTCTFSAWALIIINYTDTKGPLHVLCSGPDYSLQISKCINSLSIVMTALTQMNSVLIVVQI